MGVSHNSDAHPLGDQATSAATSKVSFADLSVNGVLPVLGPQGRHNESEDDDVIPTKIPPTARLPRSPSSGVP
jgi:hypothetical protein